MNFIKGTAVIYTCVIAACVFGGGGLIRLYGETCGLSLFDPKSWISSIILVGSPWCRGLNWLGYVTTSVIENVWYHMIANIITWVCSNSGYMGTIRNNRKGVNMGDIRNSAKID